MILATSRNLALAAALARAMAGCGTRPQVVAPTDFSIIREYHLDADVVDAQPAWSPIDYRVLARSSNGFVLLQGDDGPHAGDRYRSIEGRESHFPAWINAKQVVFGPSRNADVAADGRVMPTTQGLTVVTLGRDPSQRQISKNGYRPRIGQGRIFAQFEDHILVIDERGGIEDFGRGFFAEPQRVGEGVAWQETPVCEPDYWTGKPVRSNLIIRWHPGVVDQVTAGLQPAWTADGALAATVVRADPAPGRPWWKSGTDVIFMSHPGAVPLIIAHDARDAAPCPTQPVIAVSTNAGRVALVSRDGTTSVELCDGSHPQWSHDGTRLLVEPAPEDAPSGKLPTTRAQVPAEGEAATPSSLKERMTVYVLAVKAPN
jgi:hypothetical protein